MKFALALVLIAASVVASAQTTYRWVDPATGRTVFSDQPPPPNVKQAAKQEQAAPSDERQMPFATRMAAEKFPVVLFTSADCIEACKQGRALLNGRGVPFKEKMIPSADSPEAEELRKLTPGELTVPVVAVGRQTYKGFSAEAWNNLLDLADYPKSAGFGAKPSGGLTQ